VWPTWLTQSMWVTHSRMLCSLPMSCLVLPLDRFDSEGWFSCDQVIFLTVSCFLVKKHAAFKWKDAISGFPVSPGSAETLVRCGGKIKYSLIAYFLGNIYAKNCRNRTVYVKIIASCKGGTFFETQCIFHLKLIACLTSPIVVCSSISLQENEPTHLILECWSFTYQFQTASLTRIYVQQHCRKNIARSPKHGAAEAQLAVLKVSTSQTLTCYDD